MEVFDVLHYLTIYSWLLNNMGLNFSFLLICEFFSWPKFKGQLHIDPCSVNSFLNSSEAFSSLLFLAFQNYCFWVKDQLSFVGNLIANFIVLCTSMGLDLNQWTTAWASLLLERAVEIHCLGIHLELWSSTEKQGRFSCNLNLLGLNCGKTTVPLLSLFLGALEREWKLCKVLIIILISSQSCWIVFNLYTETLEEVLMQSMQ